MEPKTIRLIALDLDGTVFDDSKRISPHTLEVLQRALDAGIHVLPATGRPACGIPEEIFRLRGVNYAITSNGASVVRLSPYKVLYRCCLPPEKAIAAWDAAQKYDCLCDVFCDGQGYTTRQQRDCLLEYVPASLTPYVLQSRKIIPDLRAFLLKRTEGVEKLSLFFRRDGERDAALAEMASVYGLSAVVGAPHNLELTAPGANKGKGLRALADALGIPYAETMACGDSGNDLAMLQAAGCAVAMANAAPEIKAASHFITKSNQEDGVAFAVETLVRLPAP